MVLGAIVGGILLNEYFYHKGKSLTFTNRDETISGGNGNDSFWAEGGNE